MNQEDKRESDRHSMPQEQTLYVFFRVGNLRCHLPAAEVERVADLVPIHGLPRLPRGILGICSERGRVLTVVDTAALLESSEEGPPDLLPRLLVLKMQEGHLALRVDGVEEIRPRGLEEAGPDSGLDSPLPLELTIQRVVEKLALVAT